jgi:cytochrome d ubiquinol oxidase subunit I
METADVHRLQFGFTAAFHYLFPQFTMGLALLILVLKTMALRGDAEANRAARFWLKLFGLSFALGVVTGIPMEFQFGTNWARFSRASGGVIGQTLAMEGVFAFFLEASFLYFLLYQEERLGPRGHWLAALLVFIGSWLSGYFIICTNAWMQHPVGYVMDPNGTARLTSLRALLTNHWAIVQYVHNMTGAAITGSFVMAGTGAFYLLRGRHERNARRFLSVAVVVGLIASLLAAFPTGDWEAKLVYEYQPVTFAAMEGHFFTEDSASLVFIGQPNMDTLRLDNPVRVPGLLSFLTHRRWNEPVKGLSEFPREQWPQFVPLVYYAYHIMAGLGTMFILLMALGAFFLWRRTLFTKRWMLWALMLSMPFPFIANTVGWITVEAGRQPWVIYGLMRTANASSENVSSGNVGFTLIGFMGLYLLLALIYFALFLKVLGKGPESDSATKVDS